MTDLTDAELIKPSRSQWRDVWDQFKSHKGAMAGAFVFITIVAVVFLGPLDRPVPIQAKERLPN